MDHLIGLVYSSTKYQVPFVVSLQICLFIAFIHFNHTHTYTCFTVLTVDYSFSSYFYYIHSRWYSRTFAFIPFTLPNQSSTLVAHSIKMKFCFVAFFIALGLLIHGVEARKVSTYGIETVNNVCVGIGDLDQLADITSELMSKRFPEMAPIRVSC